MTYLYCVIYQNVIRRYRLFNLRMPYILESLDTRSKRALKPELYPSCTTLN